MSNLAKRTDLENQDTPPIPDGWIAMSVPNAHITIRKERQNLLFDMSHDFISLNQETYVTTIESDPSKGIVLLDRSFNPDEFDSVDVLVLVREH